ncbi:uncharacterized protein LOC110991886 isoform X1 [Pieris rapae]|uniref:uncharacterized protein LOC110991886 isoform X1 n=1 Tax=Pieris rapae TaxID=64459 RepID=UPI000B92CA0D|nr:uncharacterized protein LOC110991886 isoform X1 [Pieris rapae]XP_022113136.1 uncharacterized protein LOC110991886 isoform X1 [Pieris rapae]
MCMHMWMWFGYDVGELLFSGLNIKTRWSFALTWIVLFFVSLLFEASKVYLARVQRAAHKKLYPYRSDERRNLLCEREQGNPMEPTTSRNTSTGQVSRWYSFRLRTLVNLHQTAIFLVHNVVGYLLMLVVMVYNVQLILAVVLGMMLGYFLFGPKLTMLQMQCFGTKRVVICTPECDDTAESTTPPLLNSGSSTESDNFICQTRTCIQPSHYFPASTSTDRSNTCYYGAKRCPSKVARAKKQSCHKENSSVEAQLLQTERQGCCKESPPDTCCSSQDTQAVIHEAETEKVEREDSPQITCCHAKSTSDSQEEIMQT